MSMTINAAPPLFIDELQEAIVALEKEAEEASPDQHDPFLTTAKRYAGLILQILDRMEADGSLPFNFLTPARKIYGEIRAIGEELAQATEVNHQQYAREQSVLEGYKNFKIATTDSYEVKEFQVPTFGALMERGRTANTEMNIRQNMMLASLIKQGSSLLMEAAKTGFCNANPLNARVCSLAEPHLEKAFAVVSEKMGRAFPNQALAHELKHYSISQEKAREYGENAFFVGLMMLPTPILKFGGRMAQRSIKPIAQVQAPQYLQAAKVAESPTVYRRFNEAGNSVASVPLTEIPVHKDVYFHTTRFRKAEKILAEGRIKRLDLGPYKGAFVSSMPELNFGEIVFALNRNIETGQVLNARYWLDSHWVGFQKSIPVNWESLEYIAVDVERFTMQDLPVLAAKFSKAAGREIQVKPAHRVLETLEKRLKKDGVYVPEEWPLTFEHSVIRD